LYAPGDRLDSTGVGDDGAVVGSIGCLRAARSDVGGTMSRTNTRATTEVIQTDRAAAPIGPYSQAIRANGFVFVAGEKGIDPRTGRIVDGGIAAETRQTLENIKAILEASGSSFDRAVQSFVYMVDIGEFAEMNKVYAEYFVVNPPGRTTVGVTALPAGARVEITVTALA
jgi:2-iminobutanoate/2-iminopropanoate deaminase